MNYFLYILLRSNLLFLHYNRYIGEGAYIMFNFEEQSSSDQMEGLISRFEEMVKESNDYFFDVQEFEDIIDYYLEHNETDKCKSAIKSAIGQHPSCVGFRFKKALFLVSTHKYNEALKILDTVELLEPNNAEVFLTKGVIYSHQKKFDLSIEAYKKAIEYAEDPEEIYTNIAFEYENNGDYFHAIDYLKKVLELNPDNEAIIYELSFCFELSDQSEDSVAFFKQFIDKNPYSKSAWFNLGISYSNLELFEMAIDAYDFCLAIDETFASAHFNKANSYAHLKKYTEAIEAYEDTFKYEDPEAMTYYYIGECYEKDLNFLAALENYQKAMDLDDKLADAWIGSGLSHIELNQLATGLKCIKRAIDLESDNAEYWYILGDAQHKNEHLEEAIESYQKVSEMEPQHLEIWLDYSNIYALVKNYESASNVIKTGLEHQHQNANLYYRLAVYQLNNGESKEAYSNLQSALSIDYEKHTSLFDYQSTLKNNSQLLTFIQAFKEDL